MKKKQLYKMILPIVGLFLWSVAKVSAEPGKLYSLKVSQTDLLGQFHGDPFNADLRIFMAGNQFVLMDQLVEAFQKQLPEMKNIFYVTIPPGKELRWILKGGIEVKAKGSLAPTGFILKVLPDVYSSVNKVHMSKLAKQGLIDEFYTYSHNRLVLMASAKDPLASKTLPPKEFYDLMADPNVGISEPDIQTQGIERHIWQMYTATSKVVFPNDSAIQGLKPKMFKPGKLANDPYKSLRKTVYYTKVKSGKTRLTAIHHLETPANIRSGASRLGPVWVTEVLYQKNRLGKNDLVAIHIGGKDRKGSYFDRRDKVNYLIAEVKSGKGHNKKAAIAWIDFLRSSTAQSIYKTAGFIPATAKELAKPFVYKR